jgi:hypothetical protein
MQMPAAPSSVTEIEQFRPIRSGASRDIERNRPLLRLASVHLHLDVRADGGFAR